MRYKVFQLTLWNFTWLIIVKLRGTFVWVKYYADYKIGMYYLMLLEIFEYDCSLLTIEKQCKHACICKYLTLNKDNRVENIIRFKYEQCWKACQCHWKLLLSVKGQSAPTQIGRRVRIAGGMNRGPGASEICQLAVVLNCTRVQCLR